jgi:hypothetical protein
MSQKLEVQNLDYLEDLKALDMTIKKKEDTINLLSTELLENVDKMSGIVI